MNIVRLVATPEKVREAWPAIRRTPPGDDAEFHVAPARCATPLGAWLARTITTTNRRRTASWCELRALGSPAPQALDEVLDAPAMRPECREEHAALSRRLNDCQSFDLRTGAHAERMLRFTWPVYGGDPDARAAETTERYFDRCADAILATGGVVVSAGPRCERPPPELFPGREHLLDRDHRHELRLTEPPAR